MAPRTKKPTPIPEAAAAEATLREMLTRLRELQAAERVASALVLEAAAPMQAAKAEHLDPVVEKRAALEEEIKKFLSKNATELFPTECPIDGSLARTFPEGTITWSASEHVVKAKKFLEGALARLEAIFARPSLLHDFLCAIVSLIRGADYPTEDLTTLDLFAAIACRFGIKLETSPHWEHIQTWPDARLTEAGLTKKRTDSFAYEVTPHE